MEKEHCPRIRSILWVKDSLDNCELCCCSGYSGDGAEEHSLTLDWSLTEGVGMFG
jgi:hypothetical protein